MLKQIEFFCSGSSFAMDDDDDDDGLYQQQSDEEDFEMPIIRCDANDRWLWGQ